MSTSIESNRPGIGRRAVAGALAIVLSIVWTHTLAAVLRHLGAADAPLVAVPLTLAAIAIALLGIASWQSRHSALTVAAGAAIAVVTLEAVFPGAWAASLALVVAGAGASEAGRWLAARLPLDLDRAHLRRRWVAVLWIVLALVGMLQVARLATFMTDPESDWFLTTRHPFWAKHECLPAYVYGAELSERGEGNVYDVVHYPGLNPQAEPATSIRGMAVEDPFQYPPQFLLLPRFAIAMTRDYATIRSVWFGLQATLFLVVAGGLAAWVGGRRGLQAGLLLPLALSAFPLLHALQYGQFHLAAVALGVGAMLCFAMRRNALGGALLAMATLAKLFPGLLLVVLAAQRRWRDLAWSAGFMAAISLVAWLVLGPAPFTAFIEYQLPRLGSGAAFAFGEAWPEIREFMIADNQGIFGLVEKLREMGVPGLTGAVAPTAGKLFGVALLISTAWFARRNREAARDLQAAAWLAILGLGSMVSGGAFGDYVPLTAAWMMTVLAGRAIESRRMVLPLAACWAFQYTILGTAPIGDWAPAAVMIPLSAVGVLAALALFGWAVALAVGVRFTASGLERGSPRLSVPSGSRLAPAPVAVSSRRRR